MSANMNGVGPAELNSLPEQPAAKETRSCCLIEMIKALYRKIVIYFSPYTKVDLPIRLERLVKMCRTEYGTLKGKDRILTCLRFEGCQLAKVAEEEGIYSFLGNLGNFREALVHACALKSLGGIGKEREIPEEIRQLSSPFSSTLTPLRDEIYDGVLKVLVEKVELFIQATIQAVKALPEQASKLSQSLIDIGIIPMEWGQEIEKIAQKALAERYRKEKSE